MTQNLQEARPDVSLIKLHVQFFSFLDVLEISERVGAVRIVATEKDFARKVVGIFHSVMVVDTTSCSLVAWEDENQGTISGIIQQRRNCTRQLKDWALLASVSVPSCTRRATL